MYLGAVFGGCTYCTTCGGKHQELFLPSTVSFVGEDLIVLLNLCANDQDALVTKELKKITRHGDNCSTQDCPFASGGERGN